MKKAFLTYLFGGYDELRDPAVVSPGWDYICASDSLVESRVWQFVDPPPEFLAATECPKRRSSLVKLFHYEFLPSDYDVVVVGDACLDICCDLNDFLAEFWTPEIDLVVAKHAERKCLYAEAEAVIAQGFDDPDSVRKHVNAYRAEGFPEDQGLYACRLLIKNNRSPRLRRFLRIWSDSYMAGSRRDQLSMTYAVWKLQQETGEQLGIRGFDFDEVFSRRGLFQIRPHLLSRKWSAASKQMVVNPHCPPTNEDTLRQQAARIADLENQISALVSSTCWRITAPVRQIGDALAGLRDRVASRQRKRPGPHRSRSASPS